MITRHYNYQEWKSNASKLGYIVGGAYALYGNKNARHRHAFDKDGRVVGEYIHDKRRSRGYLTYGKE